MRWLGLAVMAALAAHAWGWRDHLAVMLWSCHVASLLLALGLLWNWPWAVGAGFLFHLAIGLPAWAIEVAVTRGTFGAPQIDWQTLATSILLHLLTPAAGAIYVWRRGLGREKGCVLLAWALYLVMLAVSRWLTPPAMNINLAHAVWGPAAAGLPSLLLFHVAGATVALAALATAGALVRAIVKRYSPSAARPA